MSSERAGGERARYARVVRHFRRRGGQVLRDECDDKIWFKYATQGYEGVVYVDRDPRTGPPTRLLKKIIVSLEEDPVTRFEALERVNAAASAHGICPKVHDVYYEFVKRGGGGYLRFCIESDFFDGRAFEELSAAARRKVAPRVRALARKMVVRCGIWHGDLHGGNVLVSADLSEVTFIDFGNGCFEMGAPSSSSPPPPTSCDPRLVALALRKLNLRSV